MDKHLPANAGDTGSVPDWKHETGHSKPVHWDNPEGWDEEGGGRGIQDGGHMHG